MKRVVAGLLFLMLLLGSVSALADKEETEASKNVAEACLKTAKAYLEEYNNREDKPDEYLAQSYHYYCGYRDFMSISRLSGILELGTGFVNVKTVEGYFRTKMDELVDAAFQKWVDGLINADDVVSILGIIYESVEALELDKEEE